MKTLTKPAKAPKVKAVDYTALLDELESNLTLQDEIQSELDPLQNREKELRGAIVQEALLRGEKHPTTSSGLVFVVKDGRVSYKVRFGKQDEALRYFMENFPGVLAPSAAKVNDVMAPMLTLPTFIERVEGTPTLSLSKTEKYPQ